MTKSIVLSRLDVGLLTDILDYIASADGVEQQDYIDNHGSQDINEDGLLDIVAASKSTGTSHIYFKTEKLRQALLDCENS